MLEVPIAAQAWIGEVLKRSVFFRRLVSNKLSALLFEHVMHGDTEMSCFVRRNIIVDANGPRWRGCLKLIR